MCYGPITIVTFLNRRFYWIYLISSWWGFKLFSLMEGLCIFCIFGESTNIFWTRDEPVCVQILESQRSGLWKTMLGSFQPSDVFPFFFLPSRAIVLFESDSDKGTLPNFKDKYCCFVRSMVNSFPLPLVSFINGPECHSGWWEVAFWGWFLGRERERERARERERTCAGERGKTHLILVQRFVICGYDSWNGLRLLASMGALPWVVQYKKNPSPWWCHWTKLTHLQTSCDGK